VTRVLAKLRRIPTAAKIGAVVVVAVVGIVVVVGLKEGAVAASLGIFAVVADLLRGRRKQPLTGGESTLDLAGANLKLTEQDVARERSDADAAARARAQDREVEGERRAVAAGADDGDDPNRVLDRHSRGPGQPRRG
jgi:hypothetical protein